MSLSDALAKYAPTVKGPKCSICHLLTTLDVVDAKILREALADLSYTHSGIARALRAEGHRVGGGTISRHRKGECLGVAR